MKVTGRHLDLILRTKQRATFRRSLWPEGAGKIAAGDTRGGKGGRKGEEGRAAGRIKP